MFSVKRESRAELLSFNAADHGQCQQRTIQLFVTSPKNRSIVINKYCCTNYKPQPSKQVLTRVLLIKCSPVIKLSMACLIKFMSQTLKHLLCTSDQRTGALHAICWWKSFFHIFYMSFCECQLTQSKSKTTITRSVHCKFNCITVEYNGR